MEAFDSAHNYFEGGRKITSPAFSGGKPYVLHATFSVGIKGKVEQGQYVDTWVADNEWKREATILNSRFARSRNGDKTYMLSDGPDAGICGFVLKAIEPIPAIDTFVESDWRIHRDPLDGVNTIRVLSGYEPQHNVFDPEHTRGYWFDDQGKLLRAFERLDLRYSNFASFNGAQIPQEIRAFQRGQLALKIEVTEMSALTGEVPAKTFDLPGHQWNRMFTAEAR